MSAGLTSTVHASATASLVFGLLLGAVCVSDLRTRRIPNPLVLAIAVTGIIHSVLAAPLLAGLGSAVAGVAVGLAIWLPFFLLRMLGAGDVKFFAAACAWLGVGLGWRAALVAAVAGGVLAVVWVVAGLGFRHAAMVVALDLQSPRMRASAAHVPAAHAKKLPYGIAMAIGLAAAAWSPRLPF